jgi:nicotinamide-nucleotide amidase
LELLGSALREQRLTLATAESCTGGLFAAMMTALGGSSLYFKGGVVAYDNTIKISLLDVPETLLAKHGAVSQQVAEAMARGGQKRLETDLCIAVTGVAGPSGGTQEKPVGTVWSALAYRDRVSSQLWQLSGDRTAIRSASCHAMLQWLLEAVGARTRK